MTTARGQAPADGPGNPVWEVTGMTRRDIEFDAEGDHLVPSALAIAAFDTAHQPKELVILPGGHFDAYTRGFEVSSGQAGDWFGRHLAA